MARLLQDLLGVENHILDDSIYRLESASGNTGKDVRLAAEIIGKSHLMVKSLGLDPHDSDSREVYAAITGLASKHDTFMRQQLGLSSDASSDELVTQLHAFICKINIPRSVWVLKHSVVKKLLKKNPPKRTKKALGYRSLDSMLKREPVPHILVAAYHIESDKWINDYRSQYRRLSQHDFESRNIDICLPDSRYWQEIGISLSSRLQTNVLDVKELGAVVLLPLPKRRLEGVCLALVILLLTHIEELRTYSSIFKLHQMHDNFGNTIEYILRDNSKVHHEVIDNKVDWKILHAYFGTLTSKDHPEFFKPHITLEDLAWRKIEDILLSIEPAFDIWKGNEYVGGFYKDDKNPVSFNLMDAILNVANDVPFENRITHNLRSSLWDEILLRYMESNFVRSRILRQMGKGGISMESAVENAAIEVL